MHSKIAKKLRGPSPLFSALDSLERPLDGLNEMFYLGDALFCTFYQLDLIALVDSWHVLFLLPHYFIDLC